jgi:hypothetical protein
MASSQGRLRSKNDPRCPHLCRQHACEFLKRQLTNYIPVKECSVCKGALTLDIIRTFPKFLLRNITDSGDKVVPKNKFSFEEATALNS